MEQEKICGNCVSWDMWCGICLNPTVERFNEEEVPFDTPGCECFKKENDDENI